MKTIKIDVDTELLRSQYIYLLEYFKPTTPKGEDMKEGLLNMLEAMLFDHKADDFRSEENERQ